MRYLMLLCGLMMLASSAMAITLVKDGRALAAIYVEPEIMAPDNRRVERRGTPGHEEEMERRLVRDAVTDLAHYLGRISGAQVGIVAGEPAADETRLPILIGAYAERRFGGPQAQSPWKQGWRMVATPNAIGLMGESAEATSYAIYEVLDRLGCRWLLPGEMGEEIPTLTTIELPEVDISAVPRILGRNIGRMDATFQRRNRCGGLLIQFNNLSTSMASYLSRETLEQHPAWNALIDGKRDVTGAYCWSNPAVAEAVANEIIARRDAAAISSFTLSQPYRNDFCECAECRALDADGWSKLMDRPSKTDRYIWFCNRVATRVTATHPDVLFGVLASLEYLDPPVREKPHPNLVPAIIMSNSCRAHSLSDPGCSSRSHLRTVIDGWSNLSPRVIVYEFAYNLAEVAAPYPQLRWVKDIPYLFGKNVFFWMGHGWVQDNMNNLEATLPGVYMGMRMGWYPDADPEAVLDEFYTRFYGAAAAPMRRYWQTIDDAWQQTPQHAGTHYGFYQRFTPAVLEGARTAMDEARRLARPGRERDRVGLADASLSQLELYMAMRRDLCEGRFDKLHEQAEQWAAQYAQHMVTYRENAAFPKLAADFFRTYCASLYAEANRIALEHVLLTPPIPAWRYQVDREERGEAAGWSAAGFDDAAWPETDPRVQSWSSLGLFNYYGSVWYRARVTLPAVPAGKKVFLWISGVDDTCRVYVNGRHIPWVTPKGETLDEAVGYARPFAFDITAAVTRGENSLVIKGTRSRINEVGTGGLLGPVVLYREK